MGDKKENIGGNKVKRPGRGRRRLLRIFLPLAGIIILVQVALYYFADPFIRQYVKQKIEAESGGIYNVEFENININLVGRGFRIRNLSIKPHDAFLSIAKTDTLKSYYDVKFPELNIKGIGVLDLYYGNILSISSVEIDQPDINFIGARKMEGYNQHNKIYNDLYPYLKKYVNALVIDELRFSNGSIVLNNSELGRTGVSTAGDIYITLNGFRIDANSSDSQYRLLFSDHINLDIEDYRLRLGDGIHVLEAEEVNLSTASSSISGKKIWLLPTMAPDSVKNDENEEFYDVYIPEIQIDGADIYKAYFENIFEIEHVNLIDPEIRFITKRKLSDLNNGGDAEKNLYSLSSTYLDEIHVDSFNIENGKFALAKDIDQSKSDLSAESISLAVSNFLVDSNSYQNLDKIFYADQLTVKVGSYLMDLADSVHQLAADRVEFSTKSNRAIASNVTLQPRDKAKTLSNQFKDEMYDMTVPQLEFSGVDFPKLYNLRQLDFRLLKVNNPIVKISDYQRNKPRNRQLDEASLYRLIKNYIKSIYVNQIQLEKGSLEFAKYRGAKKDTVRAGKIAFKLDNFRLDSVGQYTSNRIFFADHIQFTLEDYLMRLSDDLHILRANKIGISTIKSEIYANDIELFPIPVRNITRYLERSKRSVLYNVDIPSLVIRGADIRKAYFQQILNISNITIKEPTFKLNRYTNIENKQKRTNKSRKDDLYDLFADYLKSINISKMNLNNGVFNVVTNTGSDANTLSNNNVSIEATNFILNYESSTRKDRIFYSDDIEVNLDNYVVNLPDSIHVLKTKRLGISTAKSEMYLKSTRLHPISNRLDTVNLSAFYDVEVPDIVMKGVDIRKLYDQSVLEINKIELTNPTMSIINQVEIKGKNSFINSKRKRNMPIQLKGIKIKNARIINGKLALGNLIGNRERIFSRADLNLELQDFLLDSLILNNNRKILYANNVMIQMHDYNMRLPDSIHHIFADQVDISSGRGRITAKKFRLLPKRNGNYQQLLSGQKNKMLYDFEFPTVQLTGVDLERAYLQKNYTVKNARIDYPVVKLTSYKEPQKDGERIDPRDILNQLLSKNLKFLNIQQLDFDNARFVLDRVNDPKNRITQLDQMSGRVRNFNLNEKSKQIDSRLFYADDIDLRIKNYSYMLPDSLYAFKADEIGVSLARSRIYFDSVRLTPRYGKFEFAKKVGHQIDRSVFEARMIEMMNFNFEDFILNDKVNSGVVNVYDFKFENFRDKRLPFKGNQKIDMPQKLLRDFDKSIKIGLVQLYNGKVSYEEFDEEGQKPGKIHFTAVNANIKNVVNSENDLRRNDLLSLNASAMLMGKGKVEAWFNTKLSDNKNNFTFRGKIDRMDFRDINPMLENVAFISVKSGINDGLTYDFKGNNEFAVGKMRFRYNDLKVTVIKKKTGDKGGFASFLANTFVINNKNPNGKNLRIGDIYYERDKEKSMFNFLWKSLLSGIKPSLGIHDKNKKDKDEKASAK